MFDELVFPSEAGAPIEMNNFSKRVFKPLLAGAGLRRIRFHDLHHTFGRLLIQAGVSLACARDQMGHSSIPVTVDIYGHLIPGANVAFVDRLDAATELSPQDSRRKEGHANRMHSRKCLGMNGWEAGIRTPIRRSRVCSPTVRRPPSGRTSLTSSLRTSCCQDLWPAGPRVHKLSRNSVPSRESNRRPASVRGSDGPVIF
jgi:hypothetical protein